MSEDPNPDDTPDDQPDDEEAEWNERVGPRLRTLIREELDEHHKRTQPPKDEKPKNDEKPDPPKDETKKDDDDGSTSKPRKRTLARRWFGID